MGNMQSAGGTDEMPAESYAGLPIQSEKRIDYPGLDQHIDPSELMN